MASAIMHLCIAKKLNEKLKRNEEMFFLGAIAPDLSKQLGTPREVSHFGVRTDINAFKAKYSDYLNNDFELGYYVHLLSDIIFQDEYLDRVIYGNNVKLLNGKEKNISNDEISYLVYNDYTNLNISLIDYYNLNLDMFFDSVNLPTTSIDEIDTSKLQVLVDKMGIILTESRREKNYIFDISSVVEYIDTAVVRILKDLEFKEVDLHMHSNNSDGSASVTEILKTCERERISLMSLTDHDTVSGYKELKRKRKLYSGKVISGCEITTTYNGAAVEILAYGFDIKKMEKELKKNVIPYNKKRKLILKKIADSYISKGIMFDKNAAKKLLKTMFDSIVSFSENDKFFSDINYKNDFKDFYRKEHSNSTSQFFVDLSEIHPSMEQVVTMIHNASGYAFLAHFYEYDESVRVGLMERAILANVDGFECFHPTHSLDESTLLVRFCREHNLLISGGSDYHGTNKVGHLIGSVNISLKQVNLVDKIDRFL